MSCAITTYSCLGDDDSSPTYAIDDLIGEWYLESSTADDFQECPDNPPKLIITETEITFPATDQNTGCDAGASTTTLSYSFDGKTIEPHFSGIQVSIKIKSLSDSQLVWDNAEEVQTFSR